MKPRTYWCIENDLHELVPPWEGVLVTQECVFDTRRVLYPVKDQGFKRLALLNWMESGTPRLFDSEEDAKDTYIKAERKRLVKIMEKVAEDYEALGKFIS